MLTRHRLCSGTFPNFRILLSIIVTRSDDCLLSAFLSVVVQNSTFTKHFTDKLAAMFFVKINNDTKKQSLIYIASTETAFSSANCRSVHPEVHRAL